MDTEFLVTIATQICLVVEIITRGEDSIAFRFVTEEGAIEFLKEIENYPSLFRAFRNETEVVVRVI